MAVAGVGELLRARELTANLVRRDLKVRHRGTFLGMLWSLTTPLLTVALYSAVFAVIFRGATVGDDAVRPDGNVVPFAVYFFGGLVIWNLFSTAVGSCTSAITGSGYLLGKVYFPRMILPLAAVISALITFGFEVIVLLVAGLIFAGVPGLEILWVPLIVLVVFTLALGLGLILATVTVFLRDVAHFIGILLQMWFWGTPIIYSLGFLSDRPMLRDLIELNPVTGIVISFRNVVLLDRGPDLGLLGYGALVAIGALIVGFVVFRRWQNMFSEIV